MDWKYIVCTTLLGLCWFNGLSNVEAKTLLGTEECTWGPSYWCFNLTNAKNCRAVSHCIQTVWEKQTLPQDSDDVCKICVDMVTQARDQLKSNQTQEDLKAVFEGSCKLMPITVVQDECIKLVDDFVPELVETLSSEMNPQVVCSVAGLCNNARIDKMLEALKSTTPKPVDVMKPAVNDDAMCKECHVVANKMKQNFDSLGYEEFLERIIRSCGHLGSFSDSCAALVFSHFENIYSFLKNEFSTENVCHLAGTCSKQFHQHDNGDALVAVEINPSGENGKITNNGNDDLPCQFCEKLVIHLKDILLANTTDLEFRRVLEGICKQTGTFSQECLSLVDQYYFEMYNYLVKELDPEGVCFVAGICRKGLVEKGPLAPLLPSNLVVKAIKPIKDQQLIGTDESNSYKQKPLTHVSLKKNEANVKVLHPEMSQLPIERMMVALPQNKAVCTFCQYFLHYLQVEISDAGNEEKIKTVVESACNKLPGSMKDECDSFVEAYGNAVIALLIQHIDPSEVCPSLGLCPKEEIRNVEIKMTGADGDKPNCPLCLFAVQQLESVLENNKTEANVRKELDKLCNHLSAKLRTECTSFVDAYYKQLVDVVVADLTPQEVCVYLKLCKDDKYNLSSHHERIDSYHLNQGLMADHNNFRKPLLPANMLANSANGDIETNEIPDDTVNGIPVRYSNQIESANKNASSPGCVICEWVVTKLDKILANNKTDEEIKTIVHGVCSILPKNVTRECNDFITKYADIVIILLTQDLKPHQVCDLISLCVPRPHIIQESVIECVVCEESVYEMEKLLDNPNVDHKLENIIEKSCYAVPARYYDRCVSFINTYGESIIHLLLTSDARSVCRKIDMCGPSQGTYVKMTSNKRERREEKPLLGAKKCTWGPSHWCANLENAKDCSAVQYCQTKAWKAESPPNQS